MHRLSRFLRIEIGSSIFATVVALLILLGIYLLFQWDNLGDWANRGLRKGLIVLGFGVLWNAYRIWKRYKAEQDKTPIAPE